MSGSVSSASWPSHLLRARLHGLYVITEESVVPASESSGHVQITRAAIAGGASIIQLRDKSTPLPELYPIALTLRRLTRAAGVLFIVNDRPDLALACDADGVHLGPDDLPIAAARKVLGPHRLIGVSCGNAEEASLATAEGADYIGAGAIFATITKHDAGAPVGISGLGEIIAATPLPVAAIAGINASNIGEIAASGAAMACVVSAVTRAGDGEKMTAATRELVQRFGQGIEYSTTHGVQ